MQATALRRLELDLLDNSSTMSASHRLPACKPSRAAHATKALPGERCPCMRAQQGRPSPARDRALRLCLRPRSDRCSERYAYASQNDQRLGSLELCFGSTGAVSNCSRVLAPARTVRTVRTGGCSIRLTPEFATMRRDVDSPEFCSKGRGRSNGCSASAAAERLSSDASNWIVGGVQLVQSALAAACPSVPCRSWLACHHSWYPTEYDGPQRTGGQCKAASLQDTGPHRMRSWNWLD